LEIAAERSDENMSGSAKEYSAMNPIIMMVARSIYQAGLNLCLIRRIAEIRRLRTINKRQIMVIVPTIFRNSE
jgi:hypothetical protein